MSTIVGMGMGVGYERGGFDPRQLSGCQLFACTDTSAFPAAVHLTGGNVDTFTDLTGLGHHPVQANGTKQPLWVASGSGGFLRFNGSSHWMKTAPFTLAQPTEVYVLHKWTLSATAYLYDGDTSNKMIAYNASSSTTVNIYSGASLPRANTITGQWQLFHAVYNGANSSIDINGGARTTGDAGSTAASGFTLGAVATGTSLWVPADIAAVIIYNRTLSEAEHQRVVRWSRRLGQRLGFLVP